MHILTLAFAMWFLPLVSFVVLILFHIYTSPMRRTIRDLERMKAVTDARILDVIAERRSYE